MAPRQPDILGKLAELIPEIQGLTREVKNLPEDILETKTDVARNRALLERIQSIIWTDPSGQTILARLQRLEHGHEEAGKQKANFWLILGVASGVVLGLAGLVLQLVK